MGSSSTLQQELSPSKEGAAPPMLSYRADIDGLRALAIIPVLLNHADLPFLSGGFVGVDVFFVLSGFLITTILYEQIENETYSLLSFYERRAKRILPALYAVLFCTLVGAFYVMKRVDFMEMTESGVASVFFSSNIYFYWTTGYFEGVASRKPFLHTWSLAVEEQFYIFWPFVVLAVARFMKRRPWYSWSFLAWVWISSFLVSVFMVPISQTAAFYLIFFRLWELATGGVVALLLIQHPGLNEFYPNVVFSAGLVSVVGSYVLLSKDAQFPGLNALPVVLGTSFMVIAGDSEGNFVSARFRSPPVVYIGKISYSLYLVHWPLMACYRNFFYITELAPKEAAGLLAISFLLAVLSYHFLENPARKVSSAGVVALLSVVGAVTLCLLFFCASLFARNYWIDAPPPVSIFKDTNINASVPLQPSQPVVSFSANGTDVVHNSTNVIDTKLQATGYFVGGLKAKYEPKYEPAISATVDDGRLLRGNFRTAGASWDTAKYRILMYGDSLVTSLAPYIHYGMNQETTSLGFLSYHGCFPFANEVNIINKHYLHRLRHTCNDGYQFFKNWITSQHNIDLILYTNHWSRHAGAFVDVNQPNKSGMDVFRDTVQGFFSMVPRFPTVVISEGPDFVELPAICWKSAASKECNSVKRELVNRLYNSTNEVLKEVVSKFNNMKFYDIIEKLCGPETCDATANSELYMFDRFHLSQSANVVPPIAERMQIAQMLDNAMNMRPL